MKSLQIISFYLILISILCLGGDKVDGATKLYTDNNNGVLTITYNNIDNVKMKIGITKDSSSYYYDLVNGENTIDVPLTLGNGIYHIRVYKNINGTKYCVVASEEYSLDLKNSDDVFLQPNVIVNYTVDYNAIIKAKELTKNCKTDEEKIKTIYEYVIQDYIYDYDKLITLKSGYIPDIQFIYNQEKGICYDISAIMAAMLRSQGIYTKLVTGYTPNVSAYHAWNEIYDTADNEWITIDATYDICTNISGKKYKMIKKGSDYKDIIYKY